MIAFLMALLLMGGSAAIGYKVADSNTKAAAFQCEAQLGGDTYDTLEECLNE